MKTINKRIVIALSVFILIITLSAPLVSADDGGGTGNGTGGNADIALSFESSVNDGDTNVPLNPAIDLLFNKNVVNLTVRENNSKCFHLIDSEGNSVSIKIIFPDDQLRSSYKEHIFITPEYNLAQNSIYTLYIDKTLQAKNTNYLDKAYRITFTTGTAVTAAVNASLEDLADDIEVYTNKLPLTSDSCSEGTIGPTADKTADQSADNNFLSKIIIGAITVVVVLFFVIILFVRRKPDKHINSDRS